MQITVLVMWQTSYTQIRLFMVNVSCGCKNDEKTKSSDTLRCLQEVGHVYKYGRNTVCTRNVNADATDKMRQETNLVAHNFVNLRLYRYKRT